MANTTLLLLELALLLACIVIGARLGGITLGTTKVGRYLLNHSFMRPGLVSIVSGTALAMVFAHWLLG